MIALADTAQNLFVLQLLLHRLVLVIHLLNNLSRRRQLQLDVVSYIGRCWIRSWRFASLLAKLGPLLLVVIGHTIWANERNICPIGVSCWTVATIRSLVLSLFWAVKLAIDDYLARCSSLVDDVVDQLFLSSASDLTNTPNA